jgi:hypothetical protein
MYRETQILTVTLHAHGEALLKAAVLAPVPVVLVDLAVASAAALVAHLLPVQVGTAHHTHLTSVYIPRIPVSYSASK